MTFEYLMDLGSHYQALLIEQRARFRLQVGLIVAGLIFGSVVGLMTRDFWLCVVVALMMGGIPSMVLVSAFVMVLLARRASPVWKGTHSVTFGESGIEVKTPASSGFVPWSALTQLQQTRRLLVLSMPTGHLFIPMSAFGDREIAQKVVALCRAHIGGDGTARFPATPMDAPQRNTLSDNAYAPPTAEVERPVAVTAAVPPRALDVLARCQFGWERGRLWRATAVIQRHAGIRGSFWLLVVIAFALGIGAAHRWWMTVLVLVGFAVLMALVTWLQGRRSKRFFSFGPQIFDLHENGFRAYGGLMRGEWSWSLFRRFAESKEFLLLFVTHTTALYLPKSNFESESEVALARDLFQRKVGLNATKLEAVQPAS